METKLTKKQAQRLIEQIAIAVTARKCSPEPMLAGVLSLLLEVGIELPKPCHGEAHSNPYVDNCTTCAPHWGWITNAVKIGR